MKTKILLSFLLFILSFYLVSAQVPQGFNYQAIARDGSGNQILNTSLPVTITIQSDSLGGTVLWKELHSGVQTNSFGLFSLVIGKGVRQQESTVEAFEVIDWSATPIFIKTEIFYQSELKNMGSSRLWSVPYATLAGKISGTLSKLDVKGVTASPDSALFEVKNLNGQTVFAVYNEGVRVYVDDGDAKGAKGGFVIGGFGRTKAGESQSLLEVNPDSVRIYVDETAAKGKKGGFAIGGYNTAKGTQTEFMMLTPSNYFIGHNSGQAITTGLYNSTLGFQSGKNLLDGSNNILIGYNSGITNTSGSSNVFIGTEAGYTNDGFSNVFIGTEAGYSNSSGDYNVAVGRGAGYKSTTASSNIFLGDWTAYNNTEGDQNVMIGDWAGYYNSEGKQNVFLGAESGWNNLTGNYNNFMGFQSGLENTDGSYNSFIGYKAGYNNTTGQYNTYLGYQAGYSGTTASGSNNIFMGVESGFSNTVGFDNIAIGNKAGRSNLDGTYNVMIGSDAGNLNVSGDYITLVGYKAGSSTIDGISQTMIGYEAGNLNKGSFNTFVGTLAGGSGGTGSFNTYVGLAAGNYATGDNNVFLGKWAGWSEEGSDKLIIENNYSDADNLNNALIFGDFATKHLKVNGNLNIEDKVDAEDDSDADEPGVLGQHNIIPYYGIGVKGIGGWYGVMGESTLEGAGTRYGVYGYAAGGDSNYGIYGNASGVTAYAGYFVGDVYATGEILQFSDKNYKKNILPLSGSLAKIMALQGVTYEWKSESELVSVNQAKNNGRKEADKQSFNLPEGLQHGVIAQDVEKVLPELVHNGADGLKSVDYIQMIPLLIEAIKDQQRQIEELNALVNSLK